MKALVTGASGFVGTWLVRALRESGTKVRVLSRGPISVGDDVEVFQGDITDPLSTRRACDGIDTVYHLAGVVGYSKKMRAQMEKVNVLGTKCMVDAALEANVSKFLMMSSVVAVGASFDKTVLNEESPYTIAHLNLGYFETKRAAEIYVRKAFEDRGLPSVIVNPSTIYGPGDAKKGSRGVQLKVARGKIPFYTGGGVSVIGIDELIPAVIEAAQHGRLGERYILSGENITIQHLFDLIAECAGIKPPSIYLPNPVVHALGALGEGLEKVGLKGPLNRENAWTSTLFHWFDCSKAQKELGLKSKPAGLAIEESVKWMKDNKLI